jgi:hypothetical protein
VNYVCRDYEVVDDSETFILFPNLIMYGAIKVVIMVTTPNIGRTEELIAPTS